MSLMGHIPELVVRQVAGAAAATTSAAAAAATSQAGCEAENEYDGRIGVRVSAIFVILVGSLFGAAFPVFAQRHKGVGVPEWVFFVVKYFGSGVIVATAFIHLLAPATDALTNECLTGAITEYPWVEGIALMTVFSLFFAELMTIRYNRFGGGHSHSDSHTNSQSHEISFPPNKENPGGTSGHPDALGSPRFSHARGEDHMSHSRDHTDNDEVDAENAAAAADNKVIASEGRTGMLTDRLSYEDYVAQMTGIFILEFGVVFHSVFVGLTLAVAGEEFNTLYVVLVFHQTFEGLGLGSRLASVPWPSGKRATPYIFALAYGLTTPIAIAVGLGVRQTYAPGSQTSLIVNGVFDSISAGILLYTGLVELMAHEFMFSSYMRRASIRVVLAAYGTMCLGAGLMALLGKWA